MLVVKAAAVAAAAADALWLKHAVAMSCLHSRVVAAAAVHQGTAALGCDMGPACAAACSVNLCQALTAANRPQCLSAAAACGACAVAVPDQALEVHPHAPCADSSVGAAEEG